MMIVQDMREKYNAGGYNPPERVVEKLLPENHVFDEEQSVKWNREQVKDYNAGVIQRKEDYHAEAARLQRQIHLDAQQVLVEEYNLTPAQASHVENFVYREHHSYMGDYFNNLSEYGEFAEELLKIK